VIQIDRELLGGIAFSGITVVSSPVKVDDRVAF
jgi:hypothetical protein